MTEKKMLFAFKFLAHKNFSSFAEKNDATTFNLMTFGLSNYYDKL
jgi:hypothetical protein